jgi:hypothetical protein
MTLERVASVYARDGRSYGHVDRHVRQRFGLWTLGKKESDGNGNGAKGVPNGPEPKNLGGVSDLTSFSSFSCCGGTREPKGAPNCFTGVRESSRDITEILSIPPSGLGRERVRSWSDETGYLRGRRMGERGGKRDGLRIERNSSSASEGKLDLIRK